MMSILFIRYIGIAAFFLITFSNGRSHPVHVNKKAGDNMVVTGSRELKPADGVRHPKGKSYSQSLIDG